MDIKFFIGPMSKNVVDSIQLFQQNTSKKIGLIPSRRQVDYAGGYANHWTTVQLASDASEITIMSDHGVPGH